VRRDISGNKELVFAAHLFENDLERAPDPCRIEERLTPVTTERDEVQLASGLKTLKAPRHGTNVLCSYRRGLWNDRFVTKTEQMR
jgi:hypothetical protein